MLIELKEELTKDTGFLTNMECISGITKDILKYFKTVRNHVRDGIKKDNIHFFRPSTAILYDPGHGEKNIIQTIYLDDDDSQRLRSLLNINGGSSSLDWIQIFNQFNHTVDIIDIRYADSNVLAQYCPEYNYLLLCDLPHTNAGVVLFNDYIWDVIKEKLNLKPLKIEKVSTANKKKERYKEIIAGTIGADPEFEVYDKYNSCIHADNIIMSSGGEIGRDGNSYVAEFRPKCHATGKGLTENLRRLIQIFSDNYKSYHLKVKGDNYAIGSHIHLGVKDDTYNKNLYTYDDITKKIFPIYKDILNTIYNTNGSCRGSYATDTPFEKKIYGFEYRSTPASIHLIPELYSLYSQVFKVLFNIRSETDYNIVLDISKPVLSVFGNSWYKLKDLYVDEVWLNKKLTGSDLEITIPKKPNFTFGDEWLPEVQQLVLERMSDIESPYDIHLYGLKQKRGIVFSTEMITRHLHHPLFEPENMRINIGLPYSFRFMTAELIGNDWIKYIREIINRTIRSVIINQHRGNDIKNQYSDYKDINNTLIDIRGMADTAYDDLGRKFVSLM